MGDHRDIEVRASAIKAMQKCDGFTLITYSGANENGLEVGECGMGNTLDTARSIVAYLRSNPEVHSLLLEILEQETRDK
jgi:hypothetical protein